jgi:hypothetical protein
MLHHVKDLSPEQRRAVENLLGRPVAEDESVSIKGIRPSAIIPPGCRRKSATKRWKNFAGISRKSMPNASRSVTRKKRRSSTRRCAPGGPTTGPSIESGA